MKIVCAVCNQTFEYPQEQIRHRHKELELELVPPNFWDVKDYLPKYNIAISNEGQLIAPQIMLKDSKLKAGNTKLIQLGTNTFLKDESTNPTGSFKDRGMDMLMHEIISHNKDKVAVVSCGSGAISTIEYAKEYGLKSIAFVHKGIDESNLKHIINADEIHYCENFIKSYEDFMKFSLINKDKVFWGFLNTNVSYMLGLRTLAYEIVKDLKDAPDIVVIPCGSGMNIVAQHLAFVEMYEAKVISKMPKIAIVEIEGANPICQGYMNNVDEWLHVICPVESKTILSNDTCFNYKKIYNIVKSGEGFFTSVTDVEIDSFIRSNSQYSMKYDYTSCTVFPVIYKLEKLYPDKKIVAVITCKNRTGE